MKRSLSLALFVIAAAASLYGAPTVAAPSSILKKICSNASGSVIAETAPTTYVESLTLQDMNAQVAFSDNQSFIIPANGNSQSQGAQADMVRYLARYAYLTGTPVNLCVGLGTIWAVEIDSSGTGENRSSLLLAPPDTNRHPK
jgi:hypothetical protein